MEIKIRITKTLYMKKRIPLPLILGMSVFAFTGTVVVLKGFQTETAYLFRCVLLFGYANYIAAGLFSLFVYKKIAL